MKLGAWKKEYPQAKIIAPSGLREKRAKQKDEDIQFDYEFSAENKRTLKLPEEIEREFDVEFFVSEYQRIDQLGIKKHLAS